MEQGEGTRKKRAGRRRPHNSTVQGQGRRQGSGFRGPRRHMDRTPGRGSPERGDIPV